MSFQTWTPPPPLLLPAYLYSAHKSAPLLPPFNVTQASSGEDRVMDLFQSRPLSLIYHLWRINPLGSQKGSEQGNRYCVPLCCGLDGDNVCFFRPENMLYILLKYLPVLFSFRCRGYSAVIYVDGNSSLLYCLNYFARIVSVYYCVCTWKMLFAHRWYELKWRSFMVVTGKIW